ncbi:oligopeptide transporter, OPT family [Undibacterium cyanobacteriorum]|uniref:Oligopeptide transporter, OPT family n=1 Tax=Undibacterium cyanobacteriorum TaxID=3073561 RepID=A0ABY9RG25_9BURK|nr:oligopeptide transporter, OPT family [Undibacterium sp. 20NA77.5]WMW79076.1 oligopeptide transporter, OPT family [Undibacterium sp. 20NA77.5]
MSQGTTTPFRPYIPDQANLPEFTLRSLLMGTILGMIFGASSLYLVLKVGLTVSASIPVAVIAITLFRLGHKFGTRDSSILENSIAQTAGSAGESLAFGLGVTMPAILILGFDLEIFRVMLVAVLGGLLGILLMIPMRRTMIVEKHHELKYPEGTACAEVLKAAADDASRAAAGESSNPNAQADASRRATIIFGGFIVGLVYKVCNIALKGWKDTVDFVFSAPLKGGSIGSEISPELLGVGYIIGPRIAAIMAAGGVLSYLLLIPMIKFFGDGLLVPLAPGTKLINAMSPNEIRGAYVLYIGAGAVAAGGLISLMRAMPLIWRSLSSGISGLTEKNISTETKHEIRRTEQSLSMKWVVIGSLGIVAMITIATPLHMNVLGALLILVFGFLFATVSSQLTGQIGQSSNPISGMTVATLLFTCLIFLLMGWVGGQYYVTALSVGAIVCIASSVAGCTSQDLKTGHLVGSTPKYQQYAILIGAFCSALLLGPILLKLNDSSTVYVPIAEVAPGLQTNTNSLKEKTNLIGPQGEQDKNTYLVWHKADNKDAPAGKYLVDPQGTAVYLVDPGINGTHNKRPDGSEVKKYDAPKAVLISYIIKGILDAELPWGLVLFGVIIAITLEMSGIPSLAFAVGVYLPLASSAPLFIGGMVRWFVDRRNAKLSQYKGLDEEQMQAAGDRSNGVLLSSGYIAGGALAGIVIAFSAGIMTDFDRTITTWASTNNPFFEGAKSDWLSLIPFSLICLGLYLIGREKDTKRDMK